MAEGLITKMNAYVIRETLLLIELRRSPLYRRHFQ